MDPVRRLRFSLVTLVAVFCAGTLGYSVIEGWSLFDSLYMTVITLATVGFREVHDLSHEGKVFTIVLIIGGTGVIAYSLGIQRAEPGFKKFILQPEPDHVARGPPVRNRQPHVARRLLDAIGDHRGGIEQRPVPVEDDQIKAARHRVLSGRRSIPSEAAPRTGDGRRTLHRRRPPGTTRLRRGT